MTALEYMERQVQKHRQNFERESSRGVPEEMLQNISKKIRYYEAAVEALMIDAVPVVRCKDCRGINPAIARPEGRCLCERNSRWVFPDDFCSCGERRSNG